MKELTQQSNTILTSDNKVFLHLPLNTYKSKRFLGTINDNVFYTVRTSKKHLLRVNQSLGFNYELIKFGNFDLICVKYDLRELWTTRQRVLLSGEFLKFSNGALELQLFLQLKYFKSSRAEAEAELKELNSKNPDLKNENANTLFEII